MQARRAEASALLTLGIMSGTSLDGVDYALCAINDRRVQLRALWSTPFPRRLQDQLHRAARGQATSWELAQWHHDLGRFYAAGARRGPSRLRPALVGLHGQTVFHHPARRKPATFQLGEPAYLAEALRVPVVNNFRAADLAAGGQGAPLATLFHVRVFGRRRRCVCVNNLGGISNVTFIDGRGPGEPRVLAFDTGPANVLLDLAMVRLSAGQKRCDRDGLWAARGRVDEELLRRWLTHPFFRRPPPKSTGRELFGEPFLSDAMARMRSAGLTKQDMIATLTEFTARSIALNYRRHLTAAPDQVVLAGGGAANPVLVARIHAALQESYPGLAVNTCAENGWPCASVEPAAFAYLAWRRWRGLTGNLAATTGASRAVLLGQLTSP